jgi:hypothetical protein
MERMRALFADDEMRGMLAGAAKTRTSGIVEAFTLAWILGLDTPLLAPLRELNECVGGEFSSWEEIRQTLPEFYGWADEHGTPTPAEDCLVDPPASWDEEAVWERIATTGIFVPCGDVIFAFVHRPLALLLE